MTQITMYSKDNCVYCKMAKALLQDAQLDFTEIDVRRDPAKLQEMLSRSNRRTVPQIFFGDEHVGGFDDLIHHLKRQREADIAA